MTVNKPSVKSDVDSVTSALETATPRNTRREKYVLYLVSLKRNDARILDDVVVGIRLNAERIGDYKRLGFKPSQLIESILSDFCAGVRARRKVKKKAEMDLLAEHFADQKRRKARMKES